ncbi:uncharacterized protein BP5553_09725 [Venustampulla echinocandica]|uniref:DNA-(apurinic or apyrimidinic site) endonuclease 2 n=1 Tax=Venustampulla echinocandica TaxID=2656787 RepID=A0A370TBV8_9HELO|nr:uncharacterized protein BP5553_09725 [Venustampulla echinocandica]RDL31516.1 hypothetical protein BP5553_09725 [Venustampulla echinocandica]
MEKHRGLRVTTWNVNGIRNPFGYQPWRQERTFTAMFDILEADIVIMQETKIQRKDLRDDMVLVPGWDVYFSLPKHKKGYSGVAIYTRNSVCAPIRAEEGITGILAPPNSSTSFRESPEDQQIGGYPTAIQLSDCDLDAATLDSEGRCVILEFPAFVLIGVYCPATRDESRDDFRLGFLNALDARVRNLIAAGKRVILTGDLNISREAIDSAKAEEELKKQGLGSEHFVSTPSRRILNQLLLGGKVIGDRDDGRESPVMVDICRRFHPNRRGMFTCWEQRTNARPGNFGARIDYVLCSQDMLNWFDDSNIQEGLMGSDHCPVYAVFKDKVETDGSEIDIKDIMSADMFKGGIRQRDWSAKDLLPTSAKLIPEFDRRRSIRDMFSKKPSLLTSESSGSNTDLTLKQGTRQLAEEAREDKSNAESDPVTACEPMLINIPSKPQASHPASLVKTNAKRPGESHNGAARALKRGKSGNFSPGKAQSGKGQSSLKGFFKPKTPQPSAQANSQGGLANTDPDIANASLETSSSLSVEPVMGSMDGALSVASGLTPSKEFDPSQQEDVVDPIVAKESWSKLLGKRVVPRCDHEEPCRSLVTKKAGMNCGRSFYCCSRPLGPSGQNEKGTEWRCSTFIWSSDWTGDDT